MKQVSWRIAALLFAICAGAHGATAEQDRATAEKFGADLVRALNQRDAPTAEALFDMHGLAERASDFLGVSGELREGYIRGVESVGSGKIIQGYFRVLDSSHGKANFMRATSQLPPRSLVRFDMGDQGFNYFEYVLRTDASGKTRAVDWYQLSTGDLMSVTVGGLGQLFMASNPGLIERLFGKVTLDEATVAQLRKVGELQRAGKYADALEALKKLPEPLASSRIIISAQAGMASFANLPGEYDDALTRLAARYSDDPGASFLLIDYYYKRKDVPQILKALDTMEKRVGVDGVTCQLRASAYLLANDLTSALKYADESIRHEPDRLAAHDSRATVLVKLARFPEAVDAYRSMEKQFHLQFTRAIFLADETFKDFVASPAFRAWLPK